MLSFKHCSKRKKFKLYIVHTVHFHSITHFLNQQNAHFLFIVQYNFFTVKSVQHVSVPYFWDHHQGPISRVTQNHKLQILVRIKKFKR